MSNRMRELRASVAIVGAATFGSGETPGFTDIELLARAARAAVDDAGLQMADIDGVCTASLAASMWALPVTEYLGLRPTFVDSTNLGGSSFIGHLLPAAPCRFVWNATAQFQRQLVACRGMANANGEAGR